MIENMTWKLMKNECLRKNEASPASSLSGVVKHVSHKLFLGSQWPLSLELLISQGY